MKTKMITIALMATLALTLVPASASAQGINLSFGKHKRGKHFGINLNIGGRHHRAHRHVHQSCCRQWQPGRLEVRHEQVWVPGCSRKIWVNPVYGTQYDSCGNPMQVLVTPGHYRTVQTGGHYETRPRSIRHPGRWVYTCGH